MKKIFVILIVVGLVMSGCGIAFANYVFPLPGITEPINKLDAGYYQGGTILDIHVTGIISLVPEGGIYFTNPDGSVVGAISGNGLEYGNAGNAYPNTYGGDGINHYLGGGINFDLNIWAPLGQFGFAGKQTTDTTDPDTIRFGAVLGTFSDNPLRDDWFYIGEQKLVHIPDGGATLFLAVHDAAALNNYGTYTVDISKVPEPTTMLLLGFGIMGLGGVSRKFKN